MYQKGYWTSIRVYKSITCTQIIIIIIIFTRNSRDIVEFGLPEMLLQPPFGLLTICFLFHSLRLSNICEGQTAVVPLFLGAHRTDHVSAYI